MLSTIGLALRARKITVGTELTLEELRRSKVYLIFLAYDASMGTQKKVLDKAKFYQCEVYLDFSSEEISHAIGKHDIKVIGITDRGFSQLLMSQKRK